MRIGSELVKHLDLWIYEILSFMNFWNAGNDMNNGRYKSFLLNDGIKPPRHRVRAEFAPTKSGGEKNTNRKMYHFF